ncbi:MAG: hypothetical protein U0840_23490 [Gemmataceae bacterium]
MRYLCTIYAHHPLTGHTTGTTSSEPTVGKPSGQGIVAGASPRQAAARAYVRFVARDRVEALRRRAFASERILALEANPRAIAPCLRKIASRLGECYQMDHLVDTWSIQVQPLPAAVPLPRRSRSSSRLLRRSAPPSPN